jgi:hypothetical protein
MARLVAAVICVQVTSRSEGCVASARGYVSESQQL